MGLGGGDGFGLEQVRGVLGERGLDLLHAWVDEPDRANDNGGHRLITVGDRSHDRRLGRIVPDVALVDGNVC